MKPARTASAPPNGPARRLSPWRFVVVFGAVRLLMDHVYEGARSITGPLLAHLGASAAVVGVVTRAGEAAALGHAAGLRSAGRPQPPFLGLGDRRIRPDRGQRSGARSDRRSVGGLHPCGRRTGRQGGALSGQGTLLSHATAATGRGRGFAVHEAMDQVGALLGPLTVAGVTGVRRNATHFRNSPRAQSDMTCVGHVVCRHIPARSRRQGHGRPAGPGRARSAAGVSVSPRRLKALPLAE
ncbi:hypothetical protein BX257_1472 [Streptomyces sp. 3212.3]|nr:hypothetical protein BX257_1472 [Streptomyces sp. 3212.3]